MAKGKKTILLIEDEPDQIMMVALRLERHGYAVISAQSGVEGLEKARKLKPDLILLDLMMPDFNGWDVYREMKNDDTLSSVPVIVVAANIPDRNRTIIDNLPPVDDYITKPFDVEQLIRSVENFL